jgi:hypothetical protein
MAGMLVHNLRLDAGCFIFCTVIVFIGVVRVSDESFLLSDLKVIDERATLIVLIASISIFVAKMWLKI